MASKHYHLVSDVVAMQPVNPPHKTAEPILMIARNSDIIVMWVCMGDCVKPGNEWEEATVNGS